MLRYSSSQPTVNVRLRAPCRARTTLRPETCGSNYVHNGLAEVSITGGGRPALTLLLADTTTAGTFWRQDTLAGPVLERARSWCERRP